MNKQSLNHIVLILAVVINLIVATNAWLHDPFIGYDADGHLDYMMVAALRLPTRADSVEYYSPPLPYYLPSLVFQRCESNSITCKYVAGKFAQGINLLLSIVITIFLIKIADLIRPQNPYFKISTLILFGLLTVYYKTFSQVRGEPYIAFFEVLSIYLVLKLGQAPETATLKDGIILGVCLGGLALSRQWALLLFPALACFVPLILIQNRTFGWKYGGILLLSVFIAFIASGWFYFHLKNTYGNFTAYALRSKTFSFSNQPLSFYRNIGIRNFLLFRSPTRKTFNNQFFPVFYSETWGDYWGYLTFRREGVLWYKSNQAEINPYLGRVNFVSLFPSLILATGAVLGGISLLQSLRSKTSNFQSRALALFFLIVIISLTGYFWYLIKYPLLPKGITIKATYMLQIFMVLPFLGATFLENIRVIKPRIYLVLLALALAVFAHNVPAMITRYWQLRPY